MIQLYIQLLKRGIFMKRKILSLFLCSVVLMGTVSGCGTDKSTTNTSSTVSETEYKTIKPPKEGWTIESLVNTMTFFGKELSFPITLEQLGDDFSIDTTSAVVDTEVNSIITQLKYNDEFVCMISYSGHTSIDEIDRNTSIDFLSLNKNEKFGDYFSVNSVSFGTKSDEIVNLLGSPTDGADKADGQDISWEYKIDSEKNYGLFVGMTSEENVGSFLVFLGSE